ncbi:MAG: folate-binding protein, partial [Burkholderiaceae bacterium]|nr:folate-binding protein [Burkholderiaceae bacterium]
YCTPQGRLLATFLLWKTGEHILLQLPREILPGLQKRLQMFVLRDQVKLADASDQFVLLGLGGLAAEKTLTAWFPELPARPYARVDAESGTLIRVADAFNAPRFQWIATAETAAKAWPTLSTNLAPSTGSAWRLAEIEAGIAQITANTQELFVPQMVNFELVGGVSFKKGCYPGQEVIARTQHLGKTKRRMLLASADRPGGNGSVVGNGADVYCSIDPGQPCGKIVNAECSGTGQVDCLVSLKTDAPAAGAVHVGSAEGPVLRFRSLPYAFPDAPASA